MTSNGQHPPEAERAELASLLPGDALDLDNASRLVRTILLSSEVIERQVTSWQWLFLDDGSLLEAAPRGLFWYDRHEVLEPRTGRHEELVAQDGVLVRFERRVRERTAHLRPIHVTLSGRAYRITSTGTVAIRRLGEPPALGPWRDFASDPSKNVYFTLVDDQDENAVVLGLWTVGVSLSFGRRLTPADLGPIYRQA